MALIHTVMSSICFFFDPKEIMHMRRWILENVLISQDLNSPSFTNISSIYPSADKLFNLVKRSRSQEAAPDTLATLQDLSMRSMPESSVCSHSLPCLLRVWERTLQGVCTTRHFDKRRQTSITYRRRSYPIYCCSVCTGHLHEDNRVNFVD